MSPPLVSVIIPAFNATRLLGEALASIGRQAYQPLEIVVIDDGSSDGTAALARRLDPRATVLEQSNAGPAAARNRGIAASQGAVIAFLDADDVWPDNKLEIQVPWLERTPALDVVLGQIRYEALDDRSFDGIRFDRPGGILSNVNLGSGLFRRTVFERVGPFDESLRFSEDHDWFLRAREQGLAIAISDQVGLYYRQHEGNLTASDDAAARGFQLAEVLKRSLDRRRQQSRGRAAALPEIPDLETP